MRKPLWFLLLEVLTLLAAIGTAVFIFQFLPHQAASTPQGEVLLPAGLYLSNPATDPVLTHLALEHSLREGEWTVFGSSELTGKSDSSLQTLFPLGCGQRVLSVGSAGFQSLPILLTLVRESAVLGPQSQITIILSPVWFTEHGTPSDAFLRFLPKYGLVQLAQAEKLKGEVRQAVLRELQVHRDEFTGLYPDWLYAYWPGLAKWGRNRAIDFSQVSAKAEPAPIENQDFDWQKTLAQAEAKGLERAQGNPLGVNQAYYARLQKSKWPVHAHKLDPRRTEVRDLYALSSFLQQAGVHAHFIMQPIHRRVYKDLEPFDELFAQVEAQLKADGHRWQSFFTEPYDLRILQDAAHFSEYAWVKIQMENCTP